MLPRICAVSMTRFASAALSHRLCHSVVAARMSVAALNRQPHFIQKRYSTVEVFGPFDPPKHLTFKLVEERVLNAIKSWDRFPQDRLELLTLDSRFSEDLGFDSLDHVEIVMSLEDSFGFEIPDKDAERLKTPRDVFNYICDREDVYE